MEIVENPEKHFLGDLLELMSSTEGENEDPPPSYSPQVSSKSWASNSSWSQSTQTDWFFSDEVSEHTLPNWTWSADSVHHLHFHTHYHNVIHNHYYPIAESDFACSGMLAAIGSERKMKNMPPSYRDVAARYLEQLDDQKKKPKPLRPIHRTNFGTLKPTLIKTRCRNTNKHPIQVQCNLRTVDDKANKVETKSTVYTTKPTEKASHELETERVDESPVRKPRKIRSRVELIPKKDPTNVNNRRRVAQPEKRKMSTKKNEKRKKRSNVITQPDYQEMKKPIINYSIFNHNFIPFYCVFLYLLAFCLLWKLN